MRPRRPTRAFGPLQHPRGGHTLDRGPSLVQRPRRGVTELAHAAVRPVSLVLARHGVVLSRATLCGWMASCAELLTPLYDLMVKRVLLSVVIHTDDTTVPVFEKRPAPTDAGGAHMLRPDVDCGLR